MLVVRITKKSPGRDSENIPERIGGYGMESNLEGKETMGDEEIKW